MATCQKKLKYCYQYDATKPGVIENIIFEGTECLKAALSSGVTSLHDMVASARTRFISLIKDTHHAVNHSIIFVAH